MPPRPGSIRRGSKLSGPTTEKFLSKSITVTIPGAKNGKEPAFAIPAFSEEVPIDGPSGKYRFLVTFEKGVAASGGEAEFYVTDPADMPAVETDVALWGNDPELVKWLKEHGIKVRPYQPGKSNVRQVILVSDCARTAAAAPRRGATLPRELPKDRPRSSSRWTSSRRGTIRWAGCRWREKGRWEWSASIRFPKSIRKTNGRRASVVRRFALRRSDGLYVLPRDHSRLAILGTRNTRRSRWPARFAIPPSGECHSELMLSVYNLGAGRFILNSLRVRQELGQDPTAERLLRNMLRYAARDLDKPAVPIQGGSDGLLKSLGFMAP